MSKKLSLEDDLSQLETIAKTLEAGDESLENSIILFEKSAAIYMRCKKKLTELQHKIEKISGNINDDEDNDNDSDI